MGMSTFTDQFKCTELSPLLKKDGNLNKMNFRPVVIFTSTSKLYESIVNAWVSFYNVSLDYLMI